MLATSLCRLDRVVLTGPLSNVSENSLLKRLTMSAPQKHINKLKEGKRSAPCKTSEIEVKDAVIQKNDIGLSFSIGLAEYSIAFYMRTVLESSETPEVTIIAPNTLQRDLIKEVYSKKRAVSDRFTEISPHIISTEEQLRTLPMEVVICAGLQDTVELEKLAKEGYVETKLIKLVGVQGSKNASDVAEVYKEVRSLLKKK